MHSPQYSVRKNNKYIQGVAYHQFQDPICSFGICIAHRLRFATDCLQSVANHSLQKAYQEVQTTTMKDKNKQCTIET